MGVGRLLPSRSKQLRDKDMHESFPRLPLHAWSHHGQTIGTLKHSETGWVEGVCLGPWDHAFENGGPTLVMGRKRDPHQAEPGGVRGGTHDAVLTTRR